jgi:3-oxoacyl-[acyl-carrier-protein] synthase-3
VADKWRATVLCGLGAWVPPRVVSNDELAQRYGTTSEWISSRTGIHARHWLDPGGATSVLAVEAGRRAMKSAGVDTVDAVVLATGTTDRPVPATAPFVASRLDLPGTAAFDVNAACSGFVYALAVCQGLIAAGTADTVLLIGADAMSAIINPDDRVTGPIFGDGGAAMVLRSGHPDELGRIGPVLLGSDGAKRDLITLRAGGSEQRLSGQEPAPADHYMTMNGLLVFRHAIVRMSEAAQAVMDRVGWQAEQVDQLVCHQANVRIVAEVADRLHIPRQRCASNIDRVANTVAASIPMALAHAVGDGTLRAGHRVVIAAFGAGLTWGATALRWPDITPV